MSLPLSESSVKTVDTGRAIAATGAVGDEKLREARPQEDDTLSSILLMLKSNTNDDDDDVAAADLEVGYVNAFSSNSYTQRYLLNCNLIYVYLAAFSYVLIVIFSMILR